MTGSPVSAESDAKSWLERMAQGCVSLLVAAVALYLAVQVLAAIWVWIVARLALTVTAWVAVVVVRRRLGGW